MNRDGSIFTEFVEGIIRLCRVVECQLESVRETLSLLDSSSAGEVRQYQETRIRIRITYEEVYTPGARPRKTTQRLLTGSGAGSSDTDGTNDDSVEGEEVDGGGGTGGKYSTSAWLRAAKKSPSNEELSNSYSVEAVDDAGLTTLVGEEGGNEAAS